MSGYLIAHIDIHDPEGYAPYQAAAPDLVTASGGEFVVATNDYTVLEGQTRPQRVVVVRFTDYARALAFYHTPQYQALVAVRQRASRMNILAVEGMELDTLPPEILREGKGPPGYVLASIVVTDPERYEGYKALSPGAIGAHGGHFIIRGGKSQALEGAWPESRLVMVAFPSYDTARAFYHSPEYREARDARAGAATFEMIALEGL